MLKKENRLKSNIAYSLTYKNNNIVKSDLLLMYAGKRKDNESYPTRVGFVVSKKISKLAVKRNRIKRLIRENVRQLFKDNNNIINNYQSLIFIPKYDISNKSYIEIGDSISILLNKLANKNI